MKSLKSLWASAKQSFGTVLNMSDDQRYSSFDRFVLKVLLFAWGVLFATVAGVVLAFLATGFFSPYGFIGIGLVVVQVYFLRGIPVVHRYQVWWFGKRTNITLGEGLQLIPVWLGISGQLISFEKRNIDLSIPNVRCKSESGDGKSGGAVTVNVSLTITPDPDRLIQFENTGGHEGVENILKDVVAEEVRQAGALKTWTEMTFAKDELAANLVLKLVEKAGDEKKLEKYHNLTEEEKRDPKIGEKIMASLLVNGIGDEHDLGIKVSRLNVKEVDPEGKLKDDAEKTAREEQQRYSELYEAETTIKVAERLAEIKDPKVREDTLVLQGHAKMNIVRGDNVGDFTKGAAMRENTITPKE